jgi:very-short-patch-repair endonuclease
MTDAERRLWGAIRYRQLGGWKFRRQAPIGSYITDFVCFEKKIIVELDGAQHVEQHQYDAKRTAWFTSEGFRVVRFWNHQVIEELDDVLEVIWQALGATPRADFASRESPHPNPPPQGGRGQE